MRSDGSRKGSLFQFTFSARSPFKLMMPFSQLAQSTGPTYFLVNIPSSSYACCCINLTCFIWSCRLLKVLSSWANFFLVPSLSANMLSRFPISSLSFSIRPAYRDYKSARLALPSSSSLILRRLLSINDERSPNSYCSLLNSSLETSPPEAPAGAAIARGAPALPEASDSEILLTSFLRPSSPCSSFSSRSWIFPSSDLTKPSKWIVLLSSSSNLLLTPFTVYVTSVTDCLVF